MALVSPAPALAPKVCPTCGVRYGADALFCPGDGTPLASRHAAATAPDDPYVGQEISGHIEIQQLVGIGAMGRVYRAFQKGIDRDVAVKILHRELSANPQLVARFHREAKVASKLQHPNVVQVHLAGQLADGALYIVMEYLDGLSLLSALAAAGGAMPLPRALHIALQLCDAAGEGHSQGVVHRDVKPDNIMLVLRGEDPDFVKVLDFGIARIHQTDQSMATAAGLIFGTARYISPEGAQGETVGPQADVYGIATLLYQMLAGRTPFEGDQAVGLLVQQIHDPPPPLRSIPRGAYVPEPLAALIMRNLAKDAGQREPDGRTFGRALVDAARASGLSPEDFGHRSFLRRKSGGDVATPLPMHLPPMAQTRQLHLTPDQAARMAPPEPPRGRGDGPSVATTKWTPPAEVAAQLAASAPSSGPPSPAPAPPSGPAKGSGVDITLDDHDAQAPAYFPSPRTEMGSDPRTEVGSAPRTEVGTPLPLPPSAYGAPPAPLQPAMDQRLPPDVTAGAFEAPRRSWGGVVALVCFLVGAGGAAAVVHHMGYFRGPSRGTDTASAEDLATRAEGALRGHHWTAPPGENVKALTDDGLRQFPGDRRFLEIRSNAANELVTQALERHQNKELAEAIALLRVAQELDPTEAAAPRLASQYQRELDESLKVAPLATTTTPAVPPREKPPAKPNDKPAERPAPLRATLLANPARSRLGQPVEFVARVATATGAPPKGPAEAPHFEIAGPGMGAGTRLPAQDDGAGTFRGAFTFFEGGRYEITFVTKADGSSLKVSRTVVAGEPIPEVPTPPGPATVTPLPTASGKWL